MTFSGVEFFNHIAETLSVVFYLFILHLCRIANRKLLIYYKLTGAKPMMTYDPFWRMMDERRISTYSLEVDYGFNKAFIHRLKHNKNMNLSSIDYICDVFSCPVEDVVVHIGMKEGSNEGYRLNAGDG